jgi:hypothetical protein
MDIIKTIPAEVDVIHRVHHINIDFTSKVAIVHIETATGQISNKSVSLTPILSAGTDGQRAVIRGFLKQILAAAVVVDVSAIPEVLT